MEGISSEENILIVASVLSLCNNYLNIIFEDDDWSSDGEVQIIAATISEDSRETPLRVQNYLSSILPNLTDEQFRSNFRLNRSSFAMLLSKVGGYLISKSSNQSGRPTIDPEKQV